MYHVIPQLDFAFRSLAAPAAGVLPVALLEGPPGCGKTAAAAEFARRTGASLVFRQLHDWSDDQELYRGVDVSAAVAGDASATVAKGVLWHAAEMSHSGRVVLCLDEIDKARERAEALLLDFLQTGRVPVSATQTIRADMGRLVVFLTSNATRQISDALLRRCLRVSLPPMGKALCTAIAAERTGTPTGVAALACSVGFDSAQAGRFTFTAQEAVGLCQALRLAESLEQVRWACEQWCGRNPSSRTAARGHKAIPALWGEVRAWGQALR